MRYVSRDDARQVSHLRNGEAVVMRVLSFAAGGIIDRASLSPRHPHRQRVASMRAGLRKVPIAGKDSAGAGALQLSAGGTSVH